VLAHVPADRRATLIAQRKAGGAVYTLDLRLQGGAETVFFDV
jgi:protocatechuate 3,4-dioxygenase alpha subunit